MKRVLIMAVALIMLLAAAACGGKDTVEQTVKQEDLFGVWALTNVIERGMVLAPEDLDMMMYLDFAKDNTVRSVRSVGGAIEDRTEPYTVSDGMMIGEGDLLRAVTYNEETKEISFTVTEEDVQLELVFGRTPNAAVRMKQLLGDADLAMLVTGVWTLSYTMTGDQKVDQEESGDKTITLRFQKDGTAILKGRTQSIDKGLTWKTLSETEIGLFAYDSQMLYNVLFDPETGMLTLVDDNNGTNLCFEKTEE